MVPNAGHLTLLRAVRSCSPWPVSPQNEVGVGWRPRWCLGLWSLCCGRPVLGAWLRCVGVALPGPCGRWGVCFWRRYALLMAFPSSSSCSSLAVVGDAIEMADLLPAALTSTNRIVSSTVRSWFGSLRRSSRISESASPTVSWSATCSSPWFETTVHPTPVHAFRNLHTSAWPLSLASQPGCKRPHRLTPVLKHPA